MPEQEYPPPRRLGRFSPDRGRDDEDPPPWADLPSVRPTREAGASHDEQGAAPAWAGPAADGEEELPAPRRRSARAMRAAARKRRRWLITGGSLVVLAGAIAGIVLATSGGSGPAAVTPGALITTFQPGELRSVPNACDSVPAATVSHYLPGKATQAAPLAVDGSAQSACNWTVDKPPVYRLLELNMMAYAPSGLASGDGSATYAAEDAYTADLSDLKDPAAHSAEPKATITVLSGLGDQAFSAEQVFTSGTTVTDVATVVVRFHNVIVTATLNGLDHSSRGSYGPVSQSQLSAAALAFAQDAEATLH